MKRATLDWQHFFIASHKNIEPRKTRIPRAGKVSAVEEPKCLLRKGRELRTKNGQVAREVQRAQKQVTSPINSKIEREDTSHAGSDDIVSEEKSASFEQGPVRPPTSDQILVRVPITGIHFDVEEAMAKMVLEPLTA